MDTVTSARVAFENEMDTWAAASGYKKRGGLWRSGDHYLTVRREPGGDFVLEKRNLGTGCLLGRIILS